MKMMQLCSLWALPLALLTTHLTTVKAATPSCSTDADCELSLAEGSRCQDGSCTNPFANGGCLKRKMPEWKMLRTCSSEDPPNAAELGFCRPSQMDYMEVRLSTQNWESAFLSTWILEILLSEMLNVPVSMEPGELGPKVDFYDIDSGFDFSSVSYDFDALAVASDVGDCKSVKSDNKDEYTSCAHVISEVFTDSLGRSKSFREEGRIDDPMPLGALALNKWYVPKRTAARYPWVTSYLGIQGESNRRFLADIFKRPTTWLDYCREVSPTNCTTDDGVAARLPEGDFEETAFFHRESYTGHFRHTDKSDCDKNPDTCTGHFVPYLCPWSGISIQQAHHLQIGVQGDGASENGGYNYFQQVQIWEAADKLEEDVMMIWWNVDPIYSSYLGTDAEFTPIDLPPAQLECLENRVLPQDECSGDPERMFGSPLGSCDYAHQALLKVVAGGLQEIMERSPKTEEEAEDALKSPAYPAIEAFQISDFQLGTIFEDWISRGFYDAANQNIREAACDFVVENFDMMQSFLPEAYPRVVKEEDTTSSGLFVTALTIACLATALVALALVLVYSRRRKKVLYHAQIGILYLILVGLGCVSVGSIIIVLPDFSASCTLATWLIQVGYALELAPLVFKVDAINRFANKGNQMKRMRLSSKQIIFSVVSIGSCVVAFLLVWTVVDAPTRTIEYTLTDDVMDATGETIVTAQGACTTESELWIIVGICWQGALLLYSLVLSVMASRMKDDINDTRSLSVLVAIQSMFVLLRVVVLVAAGQESVSMAYRSLIFSSDCIVAVMVYIFPKTTIQSEDQESDEVLPDLFLNTTVLMANVSGFSAWSSVRDPSQVFKFLEAVFSSFDELAETHRVFKVESIRDVYVAATGIPRPQKDHAVRMARFASEVMRNMNSLTKELELVYGPDTGSLSLKIVMHSGPVTGGFLKGKGARFQLFGDTVNVANKLQYSCEKGRILMSMETANLLAQAGKSKLLEEKHDKANLNGIGEIETCHLKQRWQKAVQDDGTLDHSFSSTGASDFQALHDDDRRQRLINWNVAVMQEYLKKILARRMAQEEVQSTSAPLRGSILRNRNDTGRPLDEVQETIRLPEFDSRIAKRQKDPTRIVIAPEVTRQLELLVTRIAGLYEENPFHSFEHCSHVVQAVTKMMKRIMEGSELGLGDDEERMINKRRIDAALHRHTYGISSDPLTQFACIFSALIHDAKHPAVPNPQLIKEDPFLASTYAKRSVAEQQSFDLSWRLFMDPSLRELRDTICGSTGELQRFRQLVINSVMATDLGDKQMKELRNNRWETAFSEESTFADETSSYAPSLGRYGVSSLALSVLSSVTTASVESSSSSSLDAMNRKATIVIEHIIQAADVSHTMQHWQVYRTWNERLYRELYNAYRDGRATTHPKEFWYEGELGFFDFYIIPLSKKLADCGVFGVTSDENLNYAKKNRKEWEAKGREVVAEMVRNIELEEKAVGVTTATVGLTAERTTMEMPLLIDIDQVTDLIEC